VKARLPQVVLDTNVIVAGLRSLNGASYQVLRQLPTDVFEVHVSLPLFVQYQDVLARHQHELAGDPEEIVEFLLTLDTLANYHDIHYLLRPELDDPGDDMVLEAAFAARADFIVTHNIRHFSNVNKFGIQVVTPIQFLNILGESP